MQELQVAGNTGMLPYRLNGEAKVFTYADLAEGFGVTAAVIRNAYSRNAEAWDPSETFVSHFETGAGMREARYYNARGAYAEPVSAKW